MFKDPDYITQTGTAELFRSGPLTEVEVGFKSQMSDKNVTVLPALLVMYVTDIGSIQDLKDLGWTAFNVASLAVGVGELGLALQAYKGSRFILASYRLVLGVGNMVSAVSTSYCTQGNQETDFCKAWHEYEFLLNAGLLTAASADLLYARLAKAYQGLPPKSFNDANQIKFLEEELGLGKNGGGVNMAGRQTWNGFTNIFKANADEVLEATNRIKNYRTTNNLTGGNYGYLEGAVNNATVDNQMWRSISLNNAQNEIHIFDAIPAQGAGGNEWLRITDSEYRMLNKLASDFGAVKGGKYPNITGELKIISENPYCPSCTGIIQQFHEMYPNVKLILVDGAK